MPTVQPTEALLDSVSRLGRKENSKHSPQSLEEHEEEALSIIVFALFAAFAVRILLSSDGEWASHLKTQA